MFIYLYVYVLTYAYISLNFKTCIYTLTDWKTNLKVDFAEDKQKISEAMNWVKAWMGDMTALEVLGFTILKRTQKIDK